jgi:hypothetical protein
MGACEADGGLVRRIVAVLAISMLMVGASMIPALAEVSRSPFTYGIFNDCTGEVVLIEGEWLLVTNDTVAHSVSWGHVTAVGLTSGIRYVFNRWPFTQTYVVRPPSDQNDYGQNITIHLKLTAPGSTDDLLVTETYHVLQRNGVILLNIDKITSKCVG